MLIVFSFKLALNWLIHYIYCNQVCLFSELFFPPDLGSEFLDRHSFLNGWNVIQGCIAVQLSRSNHISLLRNVDAAAFCIAKCERRGVSHCAVPSVFTRGTSSLFCFRSSATALLEYHFCILVSTAFFKKKSAFFSFVENADLNNFYAVCKYKITKLFQVNRT